MAEVVLDASVIVALLYAEDALHPRAVDLTKRLEAEGHSLVLVDFLVFEALSVLCFDRGFEGVADFSLTS